MTAPAPDQDLRRTVTCILKDLQSGHGEASDELLPLVYEQLRAIAQQAMNEERAGRWRRGSWPTSEVEWLFVRSAGTQQNLHELPPDTADGDSVGLSTAGIGISVVGLDQGADPRCAILCQYG